MFKKLANYILREDLQALHFEIDTLYKAIDRLQHTIDSNTQTYDTFNVDTLKDINFTDEEKDYYYEIGKNGVYRSIVEKMRVRGYIMLSNEQQPLTKERMEEFKGWVSGLMAIIHDVKNETSKKEVADPLTGKVKIVPQKK